MILFNFNPIFGNFFELIIQADTSGRTKPPIESKTQLLFSSQREVVNYQMGHPVLISIFIIILPIMKFQGNLDPEKGEQYLTAVVSLGWVALVADKLPDQFAVHIKNLVSRKIVKELLMKDRYVLNEPFVNKPRKCETRFACARIKFYICF